MAITATKTVEEQTWATRPDGRPAPGTHRALAHAVLAASLLIGTRPARASTSMVRAFAGLELTFPFLALRSLQQHAARGQPIRTQDDRQIVAGPPRRIGHSTRLGPLTPPQKHRLPAFDSASTLQLQAR